MPRNARAAGVRGSMQAFWAAAAVRCAWLLRVDLNGQVAGAGFMAQ